jgi:putative inorganic carbon (HCO3(-)) transporter
MGFVFTVFYIVITIISPAQFGPEWADYHALLYLAGLTALFSLPSILTQPYLRSSIQTYLLTGFIVAIGLSQVANRWFGGAIQSWLVFLPSAAVFFFIVANVTSIRRLKIITLAAVASCLVLVGEALCGYYGGFLGDTFVLKNSIYFQDQAVGEILRLRGVGFLNDPNDFAQILLIALPLIFIAWRPGRLFANSVFVLVPSGLLLWATYLTHSRGALVGLTILCLMAVRKRLGTPVSLALGSLLAVGMLALDFSGGRGISASEGADRLEAWATGLVLFKQAPIFGIGFGNFTNFNEITAHNSFVLCLAELGLVGTTLWIALLVYTTMGLNRVIALREEPAMTGDGPKELLDVSDLANKEETVTDLTFDAPQTAPFVDYSDYSSHGLKTETDTVRGTWKKEQLSTEKIEYGNCEAMAQAPPFSDRRHPMADVDAVSDVAPQVEIESTEEPLVPSSWVVAIRLALISYLTTSWFLSRTYATTTYLVLGIATATIALERSSIETRDRNHWMSVTLAVEAVGIIFVYFVVRLRH